MAYCQKPKNTLTMGEAWNKLLSGETIAACRLGRYVENYLRRQARRTGRTLVDSGVGAYMTYSLT